MSVNKELMSVLLQHQHLLLATEEHVVQQMARPFVRALSKVKTKLASLGYDPTKTYTGRRLLRLEKQLSGMVQASALAASNELKKQLVEVIRAENIAQTGILKDALPFPVDALVSFEHLPLAHIEQMIQAPLGGRTINGRLETMIAGSGVDVKNAIETSIILGEGIDKAARRIRDYVVKGSMYNAKRIARTEIHRNAIAVQRQVYDKHKNLINGITFVSTLDQKTCPSCAELDGFTWWYPPGKPPMANAPEIPVHPNCRCLFVPRTKTWRELGFSKQDLKGFPGLRDLDKPSMRPTAYGDWFKRQPKDVQLSILGRKRYADWRAGRFKLVSMRQALPTNVKPLPPQTLANLRGLGRAAKPKKPITQSSSPKVYSASTIRRLVGRQAVSAGLTRTEVASHWRLVRKGHPSNLPLMLRSKLADQGQLTVFERNAAIAKYRKAVMDEARRLVKEAETLAGISKVGMGRASQALAADFNTGMTALGKKELGEVFRSYAKRSALTTVEIRNAFAAGIEKLQSPAYLRFGGKVFASRTEGKRTILFVHRKTGGGGIRAWQSGSKQNPFMTKAFKKMPSAAPSNAFSPGSLLTTEGGVHIDVADIVALGRAEDVVSEARALSTLFHETGHALENSNEKVRAAATKFLARRTKDEHLRRLQDLFPGCGYRPDEVARKDRFWNAYVGKRYSSGDTEVVSMAMEHLPSIMGSSSYSANALALNAGTVANAVDWIGFDPEHFGLLLNIITGSAL